MNCSQKSTTFKVTIISLIMLQLFSGWGWLGIPKADAATATLYVWDRYQTVDSPRYTLASQYVHGRTYYQANSPDADPFEAMEGYDDYTLTELNGFTPVGSRRVSSTKASALNVVTYWVASNGYANNQGYAGLALYSARNGFASASDPNVSQGWPYTSVSYKPITTTYVKARGAKINRVSDATSTMYPANGLHTDGYWYVAAGQNSQPTITIGQTNKTVDRKTGNTVLRMTGTVSDANNDIVSVTMVMNGVSRTTSVRNTAWELSWNIDELSEGSFSNISISYSDGITGTQTTNYTGTISVNKTALMYYDQHESTVTTYSVHRAANTIPVTAPDPDRTWYNGYSLTDGVLLPAGLSWTGQYNNRPIADGQTGSIYGFTLNDDVVWVFDSITGTGYQVYEYFVKPTISQGKGALIQSNIREFDGTYPANGKHTDGFWYVRKMDTNTSPQLTLTDEPKRIKSGSDLTVSGTVRDLNNDTVTVLATIGGITKSTVVANTSTLRNFTLTWQDTELLEGDYTGAVFTANDGKEGSTSRVFGSRILVDKTLPTIQISAEQEKWLSDPVDVQIDYTDLESGVDPNERKYKVTGSSDAPSSWDTAEADTITLQIKEEGEWYVHATARDLAGNPAQVSTHVIRYQQQPKMPNVVLQEAGKDFAIISWSLPEMAFTSGYEYDVTNVTTGQAVMLELPEHSWKEKGLEPGTEYKYQLKARNHVGESEVAELTVLTLPAQPSELAIQAIPNDSSHVEVSFDAVQSATSYEIFVKEAETQEVAFSETVADAGKHILSKLKPNKQYSVSVTAINGTGRGEASMIGFLSLPAAPGEFNSVQIGPDWITLGWEAVDTATDYDLGRDSQSIYTGDQLQHTDEGLRSSTSYDYQIAARNDSGFGDIAYLTDVLTLPAKTEIQVEEIADDSAIVSLQPVEGIDQYIVVLDEKEYDVIDSKAERYVLTGLESGTRYDLEIYAVNASGAGLAGKATILTLPGAVSDLLADSIADTTAHLSWTAVNGADQYKVTLNGQTYNVSGTSLDASKLAAGTEYHWTVTAGNASGYGASEESVFLTLPSAADSIQVDKVTISSATISLPEVKSATSYIVIHGEKEIEVEKLPIELSGLESGQTYEVLLVAVNSTGRSVTTPFSFTTLPVAIDESDIQIGKIGQDSIEFSWEPVSGAEEYVIRNGEQEWVTKTPSVILDNLDSGKIYDSITITPVSKGGEGESVKLPDFETLPTSKFIVTAKSGMKKLDYEVAIQSKNEIVVASAKGKEFYRGHNHKFSLSNLMDGESVAAEVWTENSRGDRSEAKMVQASTLPAPVPISSEDLSGNSGNPGADPNTSDSSDKDKDKDKGKDKETPIADDFNSGKSKYFADIESIYNRDQIMKLNEMGIVQGVGQDQFEPYRSITRAEFAALIVRALNLKEDSSKLMSFADVQPGNWYYETLKVASDHQVIDGFSASRFGPKETITREQAAKMLANAIGAKQPSVMTFADERLIANWAEGEVKALAGMRIITGYPDGTFKPKKNLNRAESVSLIGNTLDSNAQ